MARIANCDLGHQNTPILLSVPSKKHSDPVRYSQFAALVIFRLLAQQRRSTRSAAVRDSQRDQAALR